MSGHARVRRAPLDFTGVTVIGSRLGVFDTSPPVMILSAVPGEQASWFADASSWTNAERADHRDAGKVLEAINGARKTCAPGWPKSGHWRTGGPYTLADDTIRPVWSQ
jgi:hypothetical protein